MKICHIHFTCLINIKEELLKQKVKNGEKIRVVFLITYSAKFGMESIYRSMFES